MTHLREYQKKIIESCIQDLHNKKKSLIVLPTGSGKTVIFSHIIKRLNLKTLIVAHTSDLIQQIKKSVISLNKNEGPPTKVATIQSIYKSSEQFDLIVIDECHRSGAKIYRTLLSNQKHALYLGVTATPFKSPLKILG